MFNYLKNNNLYPISLPFFVFILTVFQHFIMWETLVNLLGLEFRKEIHIQQNQLRDGEMTIQCKKRKKGEFICLKREYLYKYEIKR